MKTDVRYLVRIEDLSPGLLKARLLHRVVNHHCDLYQLDAMATVAVTPQAYDDLVALYAQHKETVVDIESGMVTQAAAVEDAEIRPAQKLVVELRESVGVYGAIYVARTYSDSLLKHLYALGFHWSHTVQGVKHSLPVKDAVQLDTGHCQGCATIRLLNSAICRMCVETGYSPVYRVTYELLGMIKLSGTGKRISDGVLSAAAGPQGTVQISCSDFSMATDAYDLQRILEKVTIAGGSGHE